MNLRLIIDQLFFHLRELQRPIASRRRPGIDKISMRKMLQSIGLSAPPELLELYSECDGTQTVPGEILDDIHFFPGYYWMSSEASLATYHALVQGGGWNPAWFPIFANGGGDFYAVVCDEASPDFGAVVGFLMGVSDVLVEFGNVASMMRTIERSYAEKAFFVVDGYLEANYAEMRSIARKLQPGFAEHDA